ncbi:MAG: hypothetical protein ACREFX_05840, partial [Opitutaceae bacterium]
MAVIGSQRRFFAEIRFGRDRSAIALPGGGVVYDHWHVLEPFYGAAFLPPEWRPPEARVSWIWDQPSRKGPLTAAELSDVRRRLTAAAEHSTAAGAA